MAPQFKLTDFHIHNLVSANKYKVENRTQFLSRCIDGRYENAEDLAPLAIAGADFGDMAVLYATGRQYGFDVDREKALQSLKDVVAPGKLQWHTDEHGDTTVPGSGCGHLKQLRTDPAAYGLQEEDLEILNQQLIKESKAGGNEVLLKGEHQEGAVVFIKGNYSVKTRYQLEDETGSKLVEVFVFHRSLVDARHKVWAQKLIELGAVQLHDNLDEEYLYEVLSNTTDDHLFETAKRLAKDLPIFYVTFAEDGSFKTEQQGFV